MILYKVIIMMIWQMLLLMH